MPPRTRPTPLLPPGLYPASEYDSAVRNSPTRSLSSSPMQTIFELDSDTTPEPSPRLAVTPTYSICGSAPLTPLGRLSPVQEELDGDERGEPKSESLNTRVDSIEITFDALIKRVNGLKQMLNDMRVDVNGIEGEMDSMENIKKRSSH